jgi:hypothetical protein
MERINKLQELDFHEVAAQFEAPARLAQEDLTARL